MSKSEEVAQKLLQSLLIRVCEVVIGYDFPLKAVEYQVQDLTVGCVFLGDYDRLLRPSGLTLLVVECWVIDAIACLQFSIKEFDSCCVRVFVCIDVEEVEWTIVVVKSLKNSNVQIFPENRGSQSNRLRALQHTSPSLVNGLLRTSIKIFPHCEEFTSRPQNLLDWVWITVDMLRLKAGIQIAKLHFLHESQKGTMGQVVALHLILRVVT